MFSHWFSESQFQIIGEKHYKKLQEETTAFVKPWANLKEQWDDVKGYISDKHKEMRSYFDNAHDIMRDVWEFDRVHGDERHNHATPKPVDMMERCIKSSCPVGGIVLEPFLGSGSTLMGAETTGRSCYGLELSPEYIDTIVNRWEKYTGRQGFKI
jgi:DNA modification methylase